MIPPVTNNIALVIGNGESRSWFKPCHQTIMAGVQTWGCNAIYRDGKVDNLVATDPAMQQEIYKSGYVTDNTCFFMDWSLLPGDVGETFLMGYDIPEDLIHKNERTIKPFAAASRGDPFAGFYVVSDQDKTKHFVKTKHSCVIKGKDPITIQETVENAVKMNPNLDVPDFIQKMEKDVGVWITWVDEKDSVINFDFPKGWSTGCAALHLACQNEAKEVYMLGFDLSEYNKPLNNIYKGTDNYLPASSKGLNPINWVNQMKTTFVEFEDVTFYWVDTQLVEYFNYPNLRYLTKTMLCDTLHII